MVVKAAAEIALGQAALLDHRAHRAVEHEDALAEQAGKQSGSIGLHAMDVRRGQAECSIRGIPVRRPLVCMTIKQTARATCR
jgi:hypothetical protein